MKIIFTLLISATVLTATAQDEQVKALKAEASRTITKAPDTAQKIWRKGGIYNINLAQGSLDNWAAGGDDFSLSINSLLSLYAFYKKGKQSWDNTLDFNFGYLRTTSLGSRKNDDRLDMLSKYGYSFAPKWSLSGLANFRSQLFKGYTYSNTGRTFSSAFLSPAYLLLSPGVDYKPTANFSIFVSPVTSRIIIVKNDSLSAKGQYGVAAGKHSAYELGAFATLAYLKEFNKVVTYKGRLDLFSNYKGRAKNVDLYMSNILSAKIWKALTASWNVDLIYDDDVRLFGKNKTSPALQLKSLVGFGLQLRF